MPPHLVWIYLTCNLWKLSQTYGYLSPGSLQDARGGQATFSSVLNIRKKNVSNQDRDGSPEVIYVLCQTKISPQYLI